jgi:hypothetical protein
MFEPSPFAENGLWIKAGFHCHTKLSDGGKTPEDTAEYYRAKGYGCLGVTDHSRVADIEALSRDDFLCINSTENGGRPEIIGVCVSRSLDSKLSLQERAKGLAEQGAFTIIAHPTLSAVTPDTLIDCTNIMALEVYNAYCEEAYANGIATELWDMLLGSGKRLWGVAGDDAHLNTSKRYYSDAGKAWVQIWAEKFSSQDVLNALRRGSFYSSQGPKFHSIHVDNSEIYIECDPVSQIRWKTYGLTASKIPQGFKPNGFVRIELVDEKGKKAWTNAFFQSDFQAR